MTMTDTGRDRLRELLDAVLDEDNTRLDAMAGDAYASPWHFSRQFARGTGEPPVALRRRVMLERAAWQLRGGARVTDVAFAAGYDSVEGFSRAFGRAYGHPPSAARPPETSYADGAGRRSSAAKTPNRAAPSPVSPGAATADWLPAPNGIHFHPPMHLWVTDDDKERPGMQLTAHLVHHDLDDTRALLELASGLDDEAYRQVRIPGLSVLTWDGPEESVATVLEHLVRAKEVWLASIEGADLPARGADDPTSLAKRLDAVGTRWVDTVRDIERRDAWGDRLIDALCDPPESFVLVGVVAHVLEFSAHRRQLARHLLRDAGVTVDHGDPIDWMRRNE